MKNIYLIRKDENKTGKDNWIIMDADQYEEFTNTKEGRRRMANVAFLNKRSENDRDIYIECDPASCAEIKSEYDHGYYIGKGLEESGLQILSYHGMTFEDEDINGEEIIADESVDVEAEAIRALDLSSMWSAISTLNEKDHDIIMGFYFSGDPKIVTKLACKYRMTEKKVYRRKDRILNNLRKIIGVVGENA